MLKFTRRERKAIEDCTSLVVELQADLWRVRCASPWQPHGENWAAREEAARLAEDRETRRKMAIRGLCEMWANRENYRRANAKFLDWLDTPGLGDRAYTDPACRDRLRERFTKMLHENKSEADFYIGLARKVRDEGLPNE